jgi:hypothetical protein
MEEIIDQIEEAVAKAQEAYEAYPNGYTLSSLRDLERAWTMLIEYSAVESGDPRLEQLSGNSNPTM